MTIAFVDLATQHAQVKTEIVDAVQRVLNTGQFILGGELQAFEEEFAEYCGTRHCVGVGSGTDALHLALRAFGVGPGDEVITAANTFIATAFAICHAGATPVLVDIEADGNNMDVRQLERAITPKTKAVIPVHLFGQPANMDAIREIAGEHGLIVVEDACQAHGALYRGIRIGSLGDAACFSFYPAKNLGALGDGGAIVTNNDQVAEQARILRNCGQSIKNQHPVVGFNSRLDTLQAAVLRIKLRHLDTWNKQRRNAAALYNKLLADSGIGLPHEQQGTEHVYHLFVIQHDRRDELHSYLSSHDIACGTHYPMAIHEQPPFANVTTVPDGAPLAIARSRRILSLPMSPDITEEAIHEVASAIKSFLSTS